MSNAHRDSQVEMIRSSAAAVAPRDGNLARIRALRFQTPDFDVSKWRQIAEMGWIGLAVPEEQGGIGLGMAEMTALAEELGRGLAPEPLIAGAMTARLLAASGSAELFDEVVSGARLVVTAWADVADAIQPAERLDTSRVFVAMSGAADTYLFSQKVDGRLVLCLFDAKHVETTTQPLQDGGLAVVAQAPKANGQVIGRDLADAFGQAFDEAALATAAYLLGVAERAFEMTLDYLKVRRQFDQSLASFQALQHRMVDLKIQLVLCRASVTDAAAALDASPDARARSMAVSRAKARAADTALLIAREAIQLHGAIGYTDEYDVGLFARKAMVVANQYGSASAHRRRFARLSEGEIS